MTRQKPFLFPRGTLKTTNFPVTQADKGAIAPVKDADPDGNNGSWREKVWCWPDMLHFGRIFD